MTRRLATVLATVVAATVMVSSAAARPSGSATASAPSGAPRVPTARSGLVPQEAPAASPLADIGPYDQAEAYCQQESGLADYHQFAGNTVDIQPQVGRYNPNGYEQIAWEAFAWDVNQNTWTLIEPWQGSGVLAPGVDQYINPFKPAYLIALPRPVSNYIIGTFYAWDVWTGSAWTGWNNYSDFTYSTMYQYADGGAYGPVSLCKGLPDVFTITEPDFTGGGMQTDVLAGALKRVGSIEKAAGQTPITASTRTAAARPRCFGKRATIVGTDGNDTIKGTPGPDVIVGLGGDDVIVGRGGNDLICAGPGDDGIVGGKGADKISGGPGGDAIIAGPGADLALGGPEVDIIDPGPGRDRVNGGGSVADILTYQLEPTGVSVDLGRGVSTGSGRDVVQGFNAVVGTPERDHLTAGSTWPQFLIPLAGNDYVDGGSAGAFVAFLASKSPVTVNLSEGIATGDGTDQLVHVNNVIGSDWNDTIIGSPAGHGYLDGYKGNDSVSGSHGAYTVDGGEGSNVCASGAAYINCQNQTAGVVSPPSH